MNPVRRIVVMHSNADYLIGLRLPLLKELRSRGLEVHALAPNMVERHVAILTRHGIHGVPCRIEPTGLNPIRDVADFFAIVPLLKRLSPDVILTNTIKPVIYGGIAAALAGIRFRYALVSGLGYAFTEDGTKWNVKKLLIRWISSLLYGVSCRLNRKVIFQNRDDRDLLVRRGICPRGRAIVVAGSGVDLTSYEFREQSASSPVFVMVARLLAEKGIREYLASATLVKAQRPDARFLLVGGEAGNPSAVRRDEIQEMMRKGIIEWAGDVEDVRPWLRQATVFVLPSYREGLPRSTLEAMATGLAVITTDVPGCRETVIAGENGLLVPPRDPASLSAAMLQLAGDPAAVRAMGKRSREFVEQAFDVSKVNEAMCSILGVGIGGGA
jgi:glycosyltransferase involved in cell wall biosynthesis